jgi:chondroitin synthase
MTRSLDEYLRVRKKLGSIGAIDFLIEKNEMPCITYNPFYSKKIDTPKNLETYQRPPAVLPKNFELLPVRGTSNDYNFLLKELDTKSKPAISIVVLNFNRAEPLRKTLTGIFNQSYPLDKIEVIVTDDGSKEDTLAVVKEFTKKIDIKYFWHPDIGFTPSIARNKGVSIAKNDFIILLDVDMYPGPDLVRNYACYAPIIAQAALIGPRKYVDLTKVSAEALKENKHLIEDLPIIITNNEVANSVKENISVDWRLEPIEQSDNLRNEKIPFRMFAAGNVAFSKLEFEKVGGFDERFTAWGFEDGEVGFRFFNNGLYIIPVLDAWAYHQEPEGRNNEIDRVAGKNKSAHHYADVCPYYRGLVDLKKRYQVPKVSIYIPAYNAEKTIVDAIESALSQTYEDLEVCICDDGSTDRTLAIIEKYYTNNPRVRWVSQPNQGIGTASNTAVKLCKGLYIGQLDSDDILAKDAVEKCIPFFEKDMNTGLVYTSYENEQINGEITPGYNYPVYSREKLITAMIAHHFRMFRRRDWARAGGFNERLENAVDFDFFLRLSERTLAHHLNIIAYRRRLHGENTSLVNNIKQNKNAAIAVNASLVRQGLEPICHLESQESPKLLFNKPSNTI